jgi:hypothetical protein
MRKSFGPTKKNQTKKETNSEKTNKSEKEKKPKLEKVKIIKWKEGLWSELFLVPDLCFDIVSFLDFSSIQNLSKVSRELYPILQSEDCWQSLSENQILVKEKPEKELTWKEFYVFMICDHQVSNPKDFRGAWSPGNNYWEIKQQTTLKGDGFVYYLKNGLWWFDVQCPINKKVLPMSYYGYWLIKDSTNGDYDFSVKVGDESIVQNFSIKDKNWVVVRLGPFTTKGGDSSLGSLGNIESTYKSAFEVAWFRLIPCVGSSLFESKLNLKQLSSIDLIKVFKAE